MLAMIDNLKDFNMAASSVPPVVSQQNMDTPRPSSVARDGARDAKNKIKEGYSPVKPIELLIIKVVPLTVVPALRYPKPKRRKRGRDPLLDSRKLDHLMAGCMSRGKEPMSNTLTKLTRCSFIMNGTNKQFRSIKEIDKQFELKEKKIQSITPQALQENDRQKLAHDSGSNMPKKKRSIANKRRRREITGNDHQKLESPLVIDLTNVYRILVSTNLRRRGKINRSLRYHR